MCLALNAGLGAVISTQNLFAVKASIDDGVLVICTGSKLKFIDAERYYVTGDIVEISQSSDSPNDDSHKSKKCIICSVYDHSHSLLSALSTFVIHYVRSSISSATKELLPFIQLQFLRPLLRAPPHLIQH